MKQHTLKITLDYDDNRVQVPSAPKKTHTALKAQANAIPDGSDVVLAGEPGNITKTKLAEILTILEGKGCNIKACTNGALFKHGSLLDRISEISYFCSFTLDTSETIIKDYADKTIFLAVVDDSNVQNVPAFSTFHDDIEIFYLPVQGTTGATPLSAAGAQELLAMKAGLQRTRTEREQFIYDENQKFIGYFIDHGIHIPSDYGNRVIEDDGIV